MEPSAWRKFWMRRLLPFLVLTFLKSIDMTWRYRETGREHLEQALKGGRGVVGAFLHGRIFLLLRFMGRPRNGRWLSMCSKSLDGDAMAKVEEKLGYTVVRGSSGRDGLQAIVDMIRRVRADPGLSSCLAVDGSRGPRGQVQGGIVALAQRTGGKILPVTASARPAHIFRKSWDRTLFPWPFARVDVVYGEVLEIPPKLDAEQVERLREELEQRLIALQLRADELSGFGDDEPVRARAEAKK